MEMFSVGNGHVVGTVQQSAATQQQKKLHDAAQQFEGVLLEQMLKPMRSMTTFGGDSGAEDGKDSTMTGYGTEMLAQAMARSGGVGIAKAVESAVTRRLPGAQNLSTNYFSGTAKVPLSGADTPIKKM